MRLAVSQLQRQRQPKQWHTGPRTATSIALAYFFLLDLFSNKGSTGAGLTITNAFAAPTQFAVSRSLIVIGNHSRQHKRQQRFSLGLLEMETNDNNDNEGKDDDKKKEKNFIQFHAQFKALQTKVSTRIPSHILEILETNVQKLAHASSGIRIALVSFVAGAVVCFGAILMPVFNEIETLSQPVTLFETILSDLDHGYVEKVDTNKLFETGVSAMLRSLDPYTEFESKQEATAMTESIGGKYGGVGLVISGAQQRDLSLLQELDKKTNNNAKYIKSRLDGTIAPTTKSNKLLPQDVVEGNQRLLNSDDISSTNMHINDDEDGDNDGMSLEERLEERRVIERARKRGIRVENAFEGYAFDYGMRVGDKLVKIDNQDINTSTSVDDVRNMLRGEPDTTVDVTFVRQGIKGTNTVTIPRTIVQINDVKLATFLGNPKDGVGYIQLSGFNAQAGQEVRRAILALQQACEQANIKTGGERLYLEALILDLRGNPGGLLTSAVDVTSLLVPQGSDIVSAKGRGFPGVLYRSRVDPILDGKTKLAVLVNGGTASAAEIVSGAVQDLDAGIIVGADRTFGKGLVQNVESLPFETALKFTVAKYYTPSGRCIQGIQYKEGGGLKESDGKYTARKVADKDKQVYFTKGGREVRDGGGIEADLKVAANSKSSALEVTLLRSNIFPDFAAQWSGTHELNNNLDIVSDETYREFQAFVNEKQKQGEIKLEALYSRPLTDLKEALKKSDYRGSTSQLAQLELSIALDVQKDFYKYRKDIKEDIAQNILARYVPESMLIERGLKTDTQVIAAAKLVTSGKAFDQLLARGSQEEQQTVATLSTGTTSKPSLLQDKESARMNIRKW